VQGTLCNAAAPTGIIGQTPMPITKIVASQSVNDYQSSSGHVCVVDAGGTLACAGPNESLQVTNAPSIDCYSSLVDITPPGGNSWTTVAVGGRHTCALEVGGVLYCWGANESGELGEVPGPVAVPTQITGGPPSWTEVAVGGHHICGIGGNLLYCWGLNKLGEVGVGEHFMPAPAPVIAL
jgi:hypothetical protein